MNSLFHPFVPAHSGSANVARLMRHVGPLAGAVFCLALSAYAETISDSAGLDLSNVKAINNQPTSKPTHGVIHNERIKPSFNYRDNNGTQIEEYRFQKGQTSDVYVKSGMGTSYNLSGPENSLPRIRERDDVDRVPSVNALKF